MNPAQPQSKSQSKLQNLRPPTQTVETWKAEAEEAGRKYLESQPPQGMIALRQVQTMLGLTQQILRQRLHDGKEDPPEIMMAAYNAWRHVNAALKLVEEKLSQLPLPKGGE